jgi:DHA1 family putative efflux transporter-like MFS transporter
MIQISFRRSVFITIVIMSIAFSLMMSMGLVSALLVNISSDLNTTVAAVGQLLTASAIISAIGAPMVGPLSDRFGRKRLLTIGLTITGIAFLGYSISTSFAMLVGFSLLVGTGSSAVFPNTLASIGDYFPSERRGRIMGIMMLGVTAAIVGGIPLGAFIAGKFGWQLSFLALGIFIIIAAISVFVIFPPIAQSSTQVNASYLSKIWRILRKKRLLYLLSTNVLMEGAGQIIEIYLVAFIMLSYSLNIEQVAPLISLIAIGQFAGALIGGQLADRFNRTVICTITQTATGLIALVLMLYTQHIWLTVLLGALLKFTFGSNRPTFYALIVSISEHERGTVTGISDTSTHLGRMLGSMGGGLIVAYLGYQFLGIASFVISLIAGSMLLYMIRSPHIPWLNIEE